MKLVSEDQVWCVGFLVLFFFVIISKSWEVGGRVERNSAVQEKQRRFEHLGAFERDWLLLQHVLETLVSVSSAI